MRKFLKVNASLAHGEKRPLKEGAIKTVQTLNPKRARVAVNKPKREFGKELTNMSINLTISSNEGILSNQRRVSEFLEKYKNHKRLQRKGTLSSGQQKDLLNKVKCQFKKEKEHDENVNTLNAQLNQISINDNKKKKIETKTPSPKQDTPKQEKPPKTPQYVEEYAEEIEQYNREVESNFLPKKDYMDFQDDLRPNMRTILFDWLLLVHNHFRLLPETLFITIRIIDNYLSKKNINRKKLQSLGVTCLILACKYEQVYFPQIPEIVDLADGAANQKEVLEMESDVLKVLEFNVTFPTAYWFLQLFGSSLELSQREFDTALYVLNYYILCYKLAWEKPSLVATAAVYISLNVNKSKYDEEKLWKVCKYQLKDLSGIIQMIQQTISRVQESEYNSIKDVFDSQRYGKIASSINWNSCSVFVLNEEKEKKCGKK